MTTELRLYTVNKGMMDSWVNCFREHIAPIHAQYGIRILGGWVNRPQNEFVWVRVFEDEADLEARTKTYNQSPERKALGDFPGTHLAKLEVRTVEQVYTPPQG